MKLFNIAHSRIRLSRPLRRQHFEPREWRIRAAPPARYRRDNARVVRVVRKTSAIGGYSRGLVHRAPRGGVGGLCRRPACLVLSQVSLLRQYKIAHSDRRLSPARTDVRAHVAKMWAARNITDSNALLSGERNRIKPGSSWQRAARPIPSGFLRLFAALGRADDAPRTNSS
jgi:hypothetical protein